MKRKIRVHNPFIKRQILNERQDIIDIIQIAFSKSCNIICRLNCISLTFFIFQFKTISSKMSTLTITPTDNPTSPRLTTSVQVYTIHTDTNTSFLLLSPTKEAGTGLPCSFLWMYSLIIKLQTSSYVKLIDLEGLMTT